MAIFLTALKLGLCFLTVGVLIGGSNGLRCMQCFKAPHFAHCEGTETCNATQLCYVEQRIVYGQTLVFAGCKDRSECDSEGCFGEETFRKKRETSSATRRLGGRELKCHHCCDSDFCNMYGCPDTLDVNHMAGSRCFNCEQIQRPEICETVKNCGSTEICVMEKYATGYEIYYRLGCERKAVCEELQKVKSLLSQRRKRQAVRFYSDCCSSHLCNGRDPMRTGPPSPLSVNYQCPTLPPLTTETTVSTTTSTSTTQSTTTTPTTQMTTTKHLKEVPVRGDECHDKGICSLYSRETACSMKWRDWARETCPKMCNLCSGMEVKRSETTSKASSDLEGCKDLLDCTIYGRDYACQGEYVPWARINCPVYCGFCTVTTKTLPKLHEDDSECADKIDCSVYGKDYVCGQEFKEWATINCPKFCGLCNGSAKKNVQTSDQSTQVTAAKSNLFLEVTTKTLPKLHDNDSECADKIECSVYGKDYVCGQEFKEWATINCPKFCGLCNGSAKKNVQTSDQSTQVTAAKPNSFPGGCRDKTDCAIYGKDYACGQEFKEWATVNCPNFCGLCEENVKTTVVTTVKSLPGSLDCNDKVDCAIYGYDYICTEEFRPWATNNCAAFCGYC